MAQQQPIPQGAAQPSAPTIVSLDFGATQSAIAYARPGNRTPKRLWKWNSMGSNAPINAAKAPTRLLLGADDSVDWGFITPSEGEILDLFKLLLVPDDLLPPAIHGSPLFQALQKKRAQLGMTATDLTAIYLGPLMQHLVRVIRLTDEQRRNMELVVTIPAGWPESVCILGPGSGVHLRFVGEARAAAGAMIEDLRLVKEVRVGDMITVVDCGGITADSTTLEITSTSPLQARDVVPSTGRLYGLALTKGDFLRVLKEKMARAGAEKDALSAIPDLTLEESAETKWSRGIVGEFTEEDTFHGIEIPQDWGVKCRAVRFYKHNIVELLESTVHDVCDLVMSQYHAASAATRHERHPSVFLCGGHSGCQYLRNKLQEALPMPTKVRWHDEINDSLTAVCRGAVFEAMAAQSLEAHTSPAEYGILKGNEKNSGELLEPGHRIPLRRDEFMNMVMTYPPVILGDPCQQFACLRINRAQRQQPDGPRTGSKRAYEVLLTGDVEEAELELELEVLGGSNAGGDVEFAIRRNGVRLGPEEARVGYYGVRNRE
ncbi:hypothetical protein C8A01DRAFT_34761 [Parachaetomium inaequale]|uniref:Actin-like ATPase domain-containing protein n=1 Tax=Parachaetomium inaequale TaxID=2588326 RepID=A0AAN6ST20_9PEZI|nr:hypothetical protein C8A01DRAFT_34761 [Parachaetomium inaequale]